MKSSAVTAIRADQNPSEQIRDENGTYAAYRVAPRSARALAAWAKAQGVPNVLDPSDMHVTTVSSRVPVPAYQPDDWEVVVEAGMMRPAMFGPESDTLVVEFDNEMLKERHQRARDLGATWDWPDYRPHVTISEDLSGWRGDFVAPPFAIRLSHEFVEPLRAPVEKGKSWSAQPRVPAGSPKGGQFASYGSSGGSWQAVAAQAKELTGTALPGNVAGAGFGVGLNAPQLGIAGGTAVGGKIVPVMPPPDPTPVAFNDNPDDVAVYVRGSDPGPGLNGVPFDRWDPPRDNEGWARVSGQNPAIEMGRPPVEKPGKSIGSGVIVQEPDGRVWVVEPTNHYGGYEHTFPKGTMEKGLSLQANAIKETFEESGLKVEITGVFGDYERTMSVARYYTARRVGGTPAGHGPESQAVKLVPLDVLDEYLNMPVDQKILGDIVTDLEG